MARFRRFRRAYRSFRGRAGAGYRRRGGARGIAGIGLPWIGGVAAGYLAPRFHPYQDVAITALAVLPIRLPYGIQNIAKGYVLGAIARTFVPSVAGVNSASGGVSYV